MPAVNVDGIVVPRTEIEIGAICPPAYVAAGKVCAEHQSVTVHFHWICPGTEGVNSNICPESAFDVVLSVNGKLACHPWSQSSRRPERGFEHLGLGLSSDYDAGEHGGHRSANRRCQI
jgi:hypothetical protein